MNYGQCIAFNPIPGVREGWKQCTETALGSRQSLCRKHENSLYGVILGMEAMGWFFEEEDLHGPRAAYVVRSIKELAKARSGS